MEESIFKIVMHPVRIKIIQHLLVGENLTTSQISELFKDVPKVTLYRHLNILLKNNIIEVRKENRIRGTIEKVYGVVNKTLEKANMDIINSTPEENLDFFFSFLLTLLNDFKNYVSQQDYDLVTDGLSFSKAILYLTDEEFLDFAKELTVVYGKVIDNKPATERKPRITSTIIIPEAVK